MARWNITGRKRIHVTNGNRTSMCHFTYWVTETDRIWELGKHIIQRQSLKVCERNDVIAYTKIKKLTTTILHVILYGCGLENREYGCGDPLRWPRDILYPQKLAQTSPTCGGRSVGIVRLRTKTTEFVCFCSVWVWNLVSDINGGT
jgi:hypothetical protein